MTLRLNANVIDSRAIIERLDELQSEADAADDPDTPEEDRPTMDEDDRTELAMLREVDEEGSGLFSEWRHGEGLIADHYFERYARELAEDLGAIKGTEGWPLDCIDWEKAVDNLKMDYSSITIDGREYWGRS